MLFYFLCRSEFAKKSWLSPMSEAVGYRIVKTKDRESLQAYCFCPIGVNTVFPPIMCSSCSVAESDFSGGCNQRPLPLNSLQEAVGPQRLGTDEESS